MNSSTTPERRAVLYVCAAPSESKPDLPAESAEEEGRTFAGEHSLAIVEVITDDFGERIPNRRPGWQQVMELVKTGAVTHVVTRWPNSISTDEDQRYTATGIVKGHGVGVCYTWKPLSVLGSHV